MDQVKIGKFIAQKRKEQALTQMQFAELLGVTNKTVSKWETGNRMPDVTVIQDVCQILKVNVNELLAGEEFEEKEYIEKTENNVIGLVEELNDIRKDHRSQYIGIFIGTVFTVGAMLLTMVHSVGGIWNIFYYFDMFSMLYLLGIVFLMLGVAGAFPKYLAAFKCCFRIKKYGEKEMDQIICTIKFAVKITWIAGIFLSLVAVVSLCVNIEHMDMLGPLLASAILSLFYTVFIEVIHHVVLYKCNLIRIENQ